MKTQLSPYGVKNLIEMDEMLGFLGGNCQDSGTLGCGPV
jgi:hypothetical protein